MKNNRSITKVKSFDEEEELAPVHNLKYRNWLDNYKFSNGILLEKIPSGYKSANYSHHLITNTINRVEEENKIKDVENFSSTSTEEDSTEETSKEEDSTEDLLLKFKTEIKNMIKLPMWNVVGIVSLVFAIGTFLILIKK